MSGIRRLPTFIIVGAAKSGTTALYEYLRQHPDIFMSPLKEPRFFAVEGEAEPFGGPFADIENSVSISSIEEYYACFKDVKSEKAIGEASTLYLYHPKAPAGIQRYIPHAKLIAILRDPVERAYSGYLMHLMQKREVVSFEEALADEPRRKQENWIWGRYEEVGHYAEQLRRYISRFGRDQIRVYLYEDLKADAGTLVADVFRFLEVDASYAVDTAMRHNVSGVPKNRFLDAVIGQRPTRYQLSRLRPYLPQKLIQVRDRMRRNNLVRPEVDPQIRARLIPQFRDDILWLQDFLDRDLSAWLQVDRRVGESSPKAGEEALSL